MEKSGIHNSIRYLNSTLFHNPGGLAQAVQMTQDGHTENILSNLGWLEIWEHITIKMGFIFSIVRFHVKGPRKKVRQKVDFFY